MSYSVDANWRLSLDYRATTTANTIISLTSHAFWNLAGGRDLGDHRLAINARRYLPLDTELIPLPGPPTDVSGSHLDFRDGRTLGAQMIGSPRRVWRPLYVCELLVSLPVCSA